MYRDSIGVTTTGGAPDYAVIVVDYRQLREHYDAVKEAMGDYLAELSEAAYSQTLLSAFDVMERLQAILNAVPKQRGGEQHGGYGVVPDSQGEDGGRVLPDLPSQAVSGLCDPCRTDAGTPGSAQTAP